MGSLLDSTGLSALITKIKNTFQEKLTFDTTPTINSENPVTSEGVYTAIRTEATAAVQQSKSYTLEQLAAIGKPATYVEYFSPQGDVNGGVQLNNPVRPSNLLLELGFTYKPSFGTTNLTQTNGYIELGSKQAPHTANQSWSVTNKNCVIYFGRISGCMLKSDYETMVQNEQSSDDGLITFANTGNFSNLLGLAVVQDYNPSTAASPITIVPKYNSSNYITGFRAIHDTSNAVTGYYIAIIGNTYTWI